MRWFDYKPRNAQNTRKLLACFSAYSAVLNNVKDLGDAPLEVLPDRSSAVVIVEETGTSGEYLSESLLAIRRALYASDHVYLTLTIRRTSAFGIGVLIAYFERAVELYSPIVNVNAYQQPGGTARRKGCAEDPQHPKASHNQHQSVECRMSRGSLSYPRHSSLAPRPSTLSPRCSPLASRSSTLTS
jgi:glucose-6-phosphate isomerase